MSESGFKNISAAAFAKLDFETVTLIDLREPDELLISGIPGAVNIPFSSFPKGIDAIPMGKPVYVFCREGSFSEEVAEILFERGYEVYNLEGGFNEYRNLLNDNSVLKRGFVGDSDAANPTILSWDEEIFVDAKALRCPGPIVKVADTLRGLPEGSVVRVEATEDAFTSDIKVWTERTGNLLLSLSAENGIISARIQKKTAAGSVDDSHSSGNVNVTADSLNGRHIQLGDDKTFIVFSGDLDKTIAAFIMANGAASLGRKVTMFFTFWGLNILRRSEKVKVDKSFIEKMFGWMMPRGSQKLGLSRMNMLGAGGKMIRGIMKAKGISSLEELIEDARGHGVRLVACQMSMDVMGIKKEELIDGVELGGVATFIGSGETSDISLFI
ncbi:MAG: DsrE/DsrF/DrsH-like family protein [Erysipelotrichaceae bacterium]|nr:DsrE/DsrF/DrsH-like family protein [Erysipelotrichaceae bacterium]